jgi:hypothetical protein
VSLPAGLTSIGSSAFESNQLTSVSLPAGLTSIGGGAFACETLVEIVVAAANPSYTGVDGILFSRDRKTLHTYPAGKQTLAFTIPAGVTTIGKRAFYNNKLRSVSLPAAKVADYKALSGWRDYADKIEAIGE